MSLEVRLNDFLAQLPAEDIAEDIIKRLDSDANIDTMVQWLSVYINEARATLRLVEPYLQKESRILEVGSGLCILSLFLKSEGYQITAEEPALAGFDHFNLAKEALLLHHQALELTVIDRTASQLSPQQDGCFELIFSNNVLEHVADIEDSFQVLCGMMAENAKMVHLCPNYVFPYEPHLHIPVVKPVKRLSEVLFKKRIIEKQALWQSLNFITYFQIKKFANNAGVQVVFKKALLFEAFNRLGYDPLYNKRHGNSAVGIIYKILNTTKLLALLKFIPPFLVSPMQFEISQND